MSDVEYVCSQSQAIFGILQCIKEVECSPSNLVVSWPNHLVKQTVHCVRETLLVAMQETIY